MAQHPTEESINITRKFLGGEPGVPGQAPQASQLPSQAAPVAKRRAFGQQRATAPQGSLGDRFLGLPGPVDFARTSQGQAMLQRILRGFGGRR